MRISYDFIDLEIFLAVMETGSFHLAAEKLNTSQSAVTRRIQKLENALEVRLFHRTTRSVKPSLAAKSFQQRAQIILNEAKQATASMRDETARLAFQNRRIITVAAVPSAIPKLLTHAIQTFQLTNANARFRILDRLANDVAETVASGEADFGISSIPPLEPNIDFELIAEDKFVLVTTHNHHFSKLNSLHWADLANESLILPTKGTGNRMLIDEAIARSELSPHWLFEVRRTSTAIEMVKAGFGFAVLPDLAVNDSKLVSIPLLEPSVIRPIGLITRSNATLSDEALNLMLCLK